MAHRSNPAHSAALAALLTLSGPALARQDLPAPQAEWAQDYAAPQSMGVRRSGSSVLSPDTLSATERSVESYRAIVAAGGWEPLRGTEKLALGARGPAVAALRARLALVGDLDPAYADSQVYDSYAQAAVRRFQARHGLAQTGAMGPATAKAMDVPATVRLKQLENNVARIRSYGFDLGRRHVVVNLPAALVETVEDGRVATRHAAGVGKVDRQSPIMNARITEVNLNPFWNAPASIIKKDLIPKMQRDPEYLTRMHIRVFDGEREIPSSQVNWQTDEATRFRFRQDPGANSNAMGFVRINIPNPHGVYMHDTPDKSVYGDDFRFVSSGCVRVQNVRGYVAWLLADTPGWTPEDIERTIQSGERIDARLSQPVPVYWVYVTAWATPDGVAQFRDDIYGKDNLEGPAQVAPVAETGKTPGFVIVPPAPTAARDQRPAPARIQAVGTVPAQQAPAGREARPQRWQETDALPVPPANVGRGEEMPED